MKNLTLEDIAKMAGVSPATVSRVINNQVGERSKVRERVLAVIEETHFQPNAAARSLAAQRTNVIGLLVPSPANRIMTHPYLLQLAEFITQSCHDRNYVLSLFLTGSESDEKRLLPNITRKGFMDGFIVRMVDNVRSDALLDTLLRLNIPFVLSGRPTEPNNNISYVAADNTTAAYHAITHLINLGRKRIAVVVGSRDVPGSQERFEGYWQALADRGLERDEALIVASGYSETSGYQATQQLLKHKPDAIFCVTRMAVDILRALREAGLRVPDDVALVGFDELPLAQQTEPPLTTMRQPLAAMGSQLVKTLLEHIDNHSVPPRQTMFHAEMVVRQSCGALKN